MHLISGMFKFVICDKLRPAKVCHYIIVDFLNDKRFILTKADKNNYK